MKKHLVIGVALFVLLVSCGRAPEEATTDWKEGAGESPALFAIEVKGKWGYIDETGKVVIEPQYDEAAGFHEELARVKIEDKWGFIDKAGRAAIRPRFEDACDFSEGLAPVAFDRSWHYVDKAGQIAIEAEFVCASEFSEGLALVYMTPRGDRWHWGYIDRTGKTVIRADEPIGPYRLHHVTGSDKRMDSFSEGLAVVYAYQIGSRIDEGGYGYIDRSGKFVIEPRLGWATGFFEGLAGVCVEGKWGYIDRKGETIIKPQYDRPCCFSLRPWAFFEGLALVLIGGKNGYIDRTGRFVIEPRFADAGHFSEGLAAASLTSLPPEYGFIDKTGKMVIQPRFDRAESFKNGLARVSVQEGVEGERRRVAGYIDKTGTFVWRSAE